MAAVEVPPSERTQNSTPLEDLKSDWNTQLTLRISEAKKLSQKRTDLFDSFCQVVVDDEVVAQTGVQYQKASPFFDDSFTLALAHNFAFVSVRLNAIDRKSGVSELGRVDLQRADLFNPRNIGELKETWHPLVKAVTNVAVTGEVFMELYRTRSGTTDTIDITVVKARDLTPQGPDMRVVFNIELDEELLKSKQAPSRHPTWDQSFTVRTDDSRADITITLWNQAGRKVYFLGQVVIPVRSIELNVRRYVWERVRPRVTDYDDQPIGTTIRLAIKLSSELMLPESSYDPLLTFLEDRAVEEEDHRYSVMGTLEQLLVESTSQAGEALLPYNREDLARSLISTFLSRGRAVRCLRALNKAVIEQATDSATLFRGNSLATKCTDVFMKLVGMDYLHRVLLPVLDVIYSENKNCEIDPNKFGKKAASKAALRKNAEQLMKYLTMVLDSIFTSVETCPTDMRKVFANIHKAAKQNETLTTSNPDTPYTAVTGFVFLRFFAPAILNPKLFGMNLAQPSERVVRTLTLLAKIITTIGNLNVSVKEDFMDPFRPVIEDYIHDARRYIDQMVHTRKLTEGRYSKHDLSMNKDEQLMEGRVGLYLPNSNAFKKRDMVLARGGIIWLRKDGKEERIPVNQFFNVERVDKDAFDNPNVLQIVTERATVYLDTLSEDHLNRWLQAFRVALAVSDNVRSSCHTGRYHKQRWTCCLATDFNAIGCGKVHSTRIVDSLDSSTNAQQAAHSLYGLMMASYPVLKYRLEDITAKAIAADYDNEPANELITTLKTLLKLLRSVNFEYLLLAKPLKSFDVTDIRVAKE
eukprot:TRINITY_DN12261_c0_g2_i1.p2 TRINITY_DN12261_c0_g2~~TRINITY_DN12261_c0_g2_i1.p2  ORF type:complete len:809 (+),score=200.99 TRINITY_DN12261_c0_g2_i1:5117-7543(+)